MSCDHEKNSPQEEKTQGYESFLEMDDVSKNYLFNFNFKQLLQRL